MSALQAYPSCICIIFNQTCRDLLTRVTNIYFAKIKLLINGRLLVLIQKATEFRGLVAVPILLAKFEGLKYFQLISLVIKVIHLLARQSG